MKSAPPACDICLRLFISPLCVAPTRPASYCAGRHLEGALRRGGPVRLVAFLNKGAAWVAPSCPRSALGAVEASGFYAERRHFQELGNLTVKKTLNSGRMTRRRRALMRGAGRERMIAAGTQKSLPQSARWREKNFFLPIFWHFLFSFFF